MARLPRVSNNVVLTQAPRSSLSAGDVADPFRAVADAFGAIGQTLQEEEIRRAGIEGGGAVIRDANGQLTVARNPYGWGKAADAYERSAAQAFIARSQIDDRAEAVRLSQDAGGDVEAFDREWRSYATKRLAGVPELARPDVELNLASLGSQSAAGVMARKRERDIKVFAADMEAMASSRREDILALARAGGTGTGEFRTALAQFRTLRSEMVGNPDFAYSQTQFDLEFKQLESSAAGEAMIGDVERIFADQGPRAALAHADTILTRTDSGLSPGEARTLNGLMRSRISDLVAVHETDMGGVVKQADDLGALLDQGEAIDNPLIADVATKLAEGGKGGKAAELLRKRELAARARNRRADGVTSADRVAELERLRAQANGAAGSTKWLRYSNQNATRNQPISPRLAQSLSFLGDMGITMEVFSGGQPGKGSGGKRTGSTRHDHGNSADVFFYKDGRKLDWANPADVPIFQEIVRKARANGVTGFGAGPGYMQQGSMHIGFGSPVAWGRGGRSANAPAWLREAVAGSPLGKAPPPSSIVDPKDIDDARKAVTEDVKIIWPSIKTGFDKYGAVDVNELVTFARQVPLIDDRDLRTEIESYFQSQAGARIIESLPASEREAVITSLRADASQGASIAEIAALEAVERAEAARAAALADDPARYARTQYSHLGPAPVIDVRQGLDAFGGSLEAGQRYSTFLQQRERVGPASVLTKGEMEDLSTFIQTATPGEQVGVLSTMHSRLRPDSYMATLEALAKDANTRALAMAGALYPDNPRVAVSILRGRQLLLENNKLAPSYGEAGNRQVIDEILPATTFGPAMEGARQQLLEAATARYADLSHMVGDTSGELNDRRMSRAIEEVIGGMLDMNGSPTIAPRYGMSQSEFDAVLGKLTDDDLANAVNSEGQPITARMLRTRGRLKAIGQGEYLVQFGPDGAATYAMSRPIQADSRMSFIRGPFVLDLGDRSAYVKPIGLLEGALTLMGRTYPAIGYLNPAIEYLSSLSLPERSPPPAAPAGDRPIPDQPSWFTPGLSVPQGYMSDDDVWTGLSE